MRVKWVAAALILVVFCATSIASARSQALPTGTVTVEATSSSGAPYTWDSTGYTCVPASGSGFSFGTTTVNCNDGAGGTPSFIVDVVDTTPPAISGTPSDISTPATSSSGATVNYTAPTASDIVDGTVPVNCSPGSGSTFSAGQTTQVTCTATDAHNNAASTHFNVTVGIWDTTPPNIGVPADITAEATSSSGAAVNFSVSFTDPDDAVATSSCDATSGATFPLGATTVTCNATDSHGNGSSKSFKITVVDTTGPVFSNVPANITTEATSTSGNVVTYTNPTANDAVTGGRPVNCSPASGSTFGIGTTPVSCSASDGNGNSSSASFNVTVQDTTPPVISNVPSDISVDATSPSGAIVSYSSPTATDLGQSVPVSCSPASGSTFPVGNNTVTCTANDGRGNTAQAQFHVIIGPYDGTPPVLNLPGDITAEATSGSGAAVSYGFSASDPDDAVTSQGCSPSSGAIFPFGTTTVNCSATDSHNNTASASFKVTVKDTTPPAMSDPPDGDITKEATSVNGAVVTFRKPTAVDTVDGTVPVSCSPASNTTFAIGVTTDTCTATDSHGNSATKTFKVTVQDTTNPVIGNMPSDIFLDATSPSGSTVSWPSPTATDLGQSVPVTCSPASGTTFAVGTTTVTCTANDGRGNTAAAQFHVSIAPFDATPPILNVPGDITAEATSGNGATVTYSYTATDPDDAVLSQSCTPVSGSTFPIGQTTVNCTATDHHNNTATKSFKVTVHDTTPPSMGNPPADITREATSASGAVVTFTKPTATDTVDGTVPVTCIPASGATFPLGQTTDTCTATDTAGNGTSKTFKVTIQDTSPPVFGAASDVKATAAPGGSTTVAYTNPTANDAVDGARPVTCTPASGSSFPIGTTTVTCRASDTSGHEATTTFKVIVEDKTAPIISVPADITTEATGPSGAPVTYSFSASDPDDAVSTSSCTPASGATFPLGTTTVNCTATDSHSNTGTNSFKVTVQDTTPPALSNMPADITTEANGPTGSKVNFAPPTAVDIVDGPIPSVPCTPASGSTFALGTTTVTCSATDVRGNRAQGTFKVKVADTTPPRISAPGDTSVYATTDSGIDASDGAVKTFIFGYHVADIADPNPKVTADNPQFFPVGTTVVKFTAEDASGNKASDTAKFIVLPKPAPGTTPPPLPPPGDKTPPANPRNVNAKAGDAKCTETWTNPTDSDFAGIEITRTTNTASLSFQAVGTVIYKGAGTSYTDRGLTNGKEYRYVLAAYDKSGNTSVGVPVVCFPKAALLRTPPDGAKLKKIPTKFAWKADPKANYYNFQLYLGGTLLLQSTSSTTAAAPKKILSAWINGPSYSLKSPWKWEGKSYKMTKGVYTWYVWPGYGARADVKYGPLMGSATFQLTVTPKPAKKPKKPKK
jgi:hypothetical protein